MEFAMKKITEKIDIIYIIQKLQELDKLKILFMDND